MRYVYKVNGVVEKIRQTEHDINDAVGASQNTFLHDIGFKILCAAPGVFLGGGGSYVAHEKEAGFVFIIIMGWVFSVVMAPSMLNENDGDDDTVLMIAGAAALISAFAVSTTRMLLSAESGAIL